MPVRLDLPAFCLAVFVAATPVRAAEPLSDAELDAVTAGRVAATADAFAAAGGAAALTETATATVATRARMQVVRLRRVSNEVTVAEAAPEREVEFAFASASARAEGTVPRADCTADILFSGPATFRTSETRQSVRPGLATCLCATYGTFVPSP